MSELIEIKFKVSSDDGLVLLDAKKLQSFVDTLYDKVFKQKIKNGIEKEAEAFQMVWDKVIKDTDYESRVFL